MGHNQRGKKRSNRQRGAEKAKPLGADLQDVLGINGQEGVGAAKQDGKKVQGDHAQDGAMVENKMESAKKRFQGNGFFCRRHVVRPDKSNQRQAEQGGEGVEEIDAQGAVAEGNHHPAGGRAGDGGELEGAGGPVHGQGKFLARNQLRQKGGAGGPKESAGHAGSEQAKINPENILFASRKSGPARAKPPP